MNAGTPNPHVDTSNSRDAVAGRTKALQMYGRLAVIDALTCLGLLGCAAYAIHIGDDDDFGPRYYTGAFIVGFIKACAFMLSLRIYSNGRANMEHMSDINKTQVTCAMGGYPVVSMLTIFGGFMGLVFLGIGGGLSDCDSQRFGRSTCNPMKQRTSYAMLGLILFAFLTAVYGFSVLCTYGKYFGIVIQSGRRHQRVMVVTDDFGTTGVPMGTALGTNNTQLVAQLQRQNELLQQQLQHQNQFSPTYQSGPSAPPPPFAPPPPYPGK